VSDRPLRILVVDSEYAYSVGGSLCRGFRALGHEATFFEQTTWIGGWVDQNPVRRLLRKASRPVAASALNFALLTEALAIKPDVILVMKGYFILPETIEALKRIARVVVSFHADDLANPKNTSDAMRRSLPLWHVLFTPRPFSGPELEQQGVQRWEYLPFGYDPELSFPSHAAPAEPGVEDAVVFVGTWDPERVAVLEPLAPKAPLRIWGNGWERVDAGSALVPALRKRQLLGETLRATFTQSGINLALLRKANRDLHQMRTFEVPACGGFLLTERTSDHQSWFEEGKEAVFFESPAELEEQIRRYLPDAAARRRIADAGHRRLVEDGHRYQDRAARIVKVVSQLM
jgi:hypothetical protein